MPAPDLRALVSCCVAEELPRRDLRLEPLLSLFVLMVRDGLGPQEVMEIVRHPRIMSAVRRAQTRGLISVLNFVHCLANVPVSLLVGSSCVNVVLFAIVAFTVGSSIMSTDLPFAANPWDGVLLVHAFLDISALTSLAILKYINLSKPSRRPSRALVNVTLPPIRKLRLPWGSLDAIEEVRFVEIRLEDIGLGLCKVLFLPRDSQI